MTPPRFAALLNRDTLPSLQCIEVATALQIPSFHIVGLPSQEVSEARERVRAAIEAAGFEFPRRRIVLNLSPASIRKQGTGLDLAMALAILATRGDDHRSASRGRGLWVAWGELGLDGSIKRAGQLLRTLHAAWSAQAENVVVADEEREEACEGLELIREAGEFAWPPPRLSVASCLSEAWEKLGSEDPHETRSAALRPLRPGRRADPKASTASHLLALSPALERAICVSASGHHHLLLIGPRGSGKSHALEWLEALHPPLAPAIRLERALLQELRSASGGEESRASRRIARRVGMGVKAAALTGAVLPTQIRPGEFTLAHGGLLLADEFPEWPRDARECLREPLERGWVTLTRSRAQVELPAGFLLAANGNSCPCGGWPPEIPLPESDGPTAPSRCRCTLRARSQYAARLSGPVLDRLDLVVRCSSQPALSGADGRERLSTLSTRVNACREKARGLWGCAPGLLPAETLENLLRARPSWSLALDETGATSLRSRHKTLRVALTLALWDELDEPGIPHFDEAACFRPERVGLA
jgi:magnesium chelatase family protein